MNNQKIKEQQHSLSLPLHMHIPSSVRKHLIKIAQFNNNLMLQDEEDDPLMRALGLNAFYNFDLKSTDLDFKSTQVEEDANIVC
ncbi:unnamed protein product [Rotaria socialis]|uniref:Uncharacterized protein n=1 Tax=Rotaria socialis TaxID=392032 RepID=A0A821FY76_9BILA|nr:unnamed protein product [Rotaria socialis]CAF4931305.1 unnamed protein product [Rotaria socialis]